jgi:hypothetical protein
VKPARAQAMLVGAVVLVGLLAVAAAHEASAGASAMAAADRDAARGDWPDAIAHARAAAEALTPGSPWPERGLRRLDAIGRDATARGDEAIARLAYAAMRTAALETRSAWSDRADWVARADEGLSLLSTTAAAPVH